MGAYLTFGNTVKVSSDVIDRVAVSVVDLIKKELPEEARCVSVANAVLSAAETMVSNSKLML